MSEQTTEIVRCPTCGPTKTEQHPRRPDITRCSNCKEWLEWLPAPDDVWTEVRAERERAHAKHGETSMESSAPDDYRRLAILTEEVGEVAREFNEGHHRGDGPDLVLLRKELIQVAAMAGAWADSIERDNTPGQTEDADRKLREQWAATDVTSVALDQWPESGWRESRGAALAEFVGDGDDVLLRRLVSDCEVAHNCATCRDCIHHSSGVGCCGCYDGSCCQRDNAPGQEADRG